MKHEDEIRLLSRRQAQEFLPFSDPTYWRMEQRGQLKAIRMGRSVFYRKADILEIVENGLPVADDAAGAPWAGRCSVPGSG